MSNKPDNNSIQGSSNLKTSATIALFLLVCYQLYSGFHLKKIGVPGVFEVEFAEKPKSSDPSDMEITYKGWAFDENKKGDLTLTIRRLSSGKVVGNLFLGGGLKGGGPLEGSHDEHTIRFVTKEPGFPYNFHWSGTINEGFIKGSFTAGPGLTTRTVLPGEKFIEPINGTWRVSQSGH